jgi:hypothetical protein
MGGWLPPAVAWQAKTAATESIVRIEALRRMSRSITDFADQITSNLCSDFAGLKSQCSLSEELSLTICSY